jgi:thioredoxin 1
MQLLNDTDFDARVIQAGVPVIVAFTAEWCAPCKWLHPVLAEVLTDSVGRIQVFAVDTDRSPGLAARYAVASVPTVILLHEGVEVERSLGVEPERLRSWVPSSRLYGAASEPESESI